MGETRARPPCPLVQQGRRRAGAQTRPCWWRSAPRRMRSLLRRRRASRQQRHPPWRVRPQSARAAALMPNQAWLHPQPAGRRRKAPGRSRRRARGPWQSQDDSLGCRAASRLRPRRPPARTWWRRPRAARKAWESPRRQRAAQATPPPSSVLHTECLCWSAGRVTFTTQEEKRRGQTSQARCRHGSDQGTFKGCITLARTLVDGTDSENGVHRVRYS